MNKYSVEMIPVSSSNVQEIGYDEENQLLYIRFHSNSLYIYKGVPSFEYDGLVNAPSIGKYLNSNIKNCYPYDKIA